MVKKMLIDATHAEETRIVVADGHIVEEFDFETINKRQLAGNIYLAKVTRVEPSLQAAFVDYGGNRHGFLAFSEIHPDYYQIPAEDRAALRAEEEAAAEAEAAEAEARDRRDEELADSAAAKDADSSDAEGDEAEESTTVIAEDTGLSDARARSEDIPGMAIVDPSDAEASDSDDGQDITETAAANDNATEEARSNNGHRRNPRGGQRNDAGNNRRPRARRYKIQEVIKTRQIMLVQVVKEERGNKGAALTTYLSLAGRYCVLMPNTARGGGISRKITNIADRKKLKEISGELEVPKGAGLIIRTAGSQRTKLEIRRDYEYLMRLWEQIRALTFKSVAPAPIYEEGDLIKRSIRDLYSKDIDEVLVEGARGYQTAKDFMRMIMPTHAQNVKHYTDPMPLFSRYQVENYLNGMFNPVVQLRSGGYIVIGITEALVAIDVNSGKATKEGSIEETAYKTNCEAADEIARQLRLRDLAGLIVVDFIDMDERKHNISVEKRFKENLKSDRARIQLGRISSFGLMEMSRQRLRPGMLESTTQPCSHCHGTGLIRSDDSLALTILRAIEEEGTRKRSREVLVKAPVSVVNFLINSKREHIAAVEARFGLSVRIEADPALMSPDFTLEKFKTASRLLTEAAPAVISADAELMAAIDEASEEQGDTTTGASQAVKVANVTTDAESDSEEGEGTNRRRRRRRRRGGAAADRPEAVEAVSNEAAVVAEAVADEEKAEAIAEVTAAPSTEVPEVIADSPVAPEVVPSATEPQAEPEPEPEAEAEAEAEAEKLTPEAEPVQVEAANQAKELEVETEPVPVAPKRSGWWS